MSATLKTVRSRRKRRLRPDEKIAKSLRVLKLLYDSEWMVSHDWGGNRDEVLKSVDEILNSEWAKPYLKE